MSESEEDDKTLKFKSRNGKRDLRLKFNLHWDECGNLEIRIHDQIIAIITERFIEYENREE